MCFIFPSELFCVAVPVRELLAHGHEGGPRGELLADKVNALLSDTRTDTGGPEGGRRAASEGAPARPRSTTVRTLNPAQQREPRQPAGGEQREKRRERRRKTAVRGGGRRPGPRLVRDHVPDPVRRQERELVPRTQADRPHLRGGDHHLLLGALALGDLVYKVAYGAAHRLLS